MCTNMSSCGVSRAQIRFPVSNERFTQQLGPARKMRISLSCSRSGRSLSIETEPNKYHRVPKAHVNSQQSSSQTPHELCLSLVSRVSRKRDRKKKKLRVFYTRSYFQARRSANHRWRGGRIFFKSLFLEPALLFTQGGSPQGRKLRLHKARVEDPAASRTLLLFFSLLLFVICNGLNLS